MLIIVKYFSLNYIAFGLCNVCLFVTFITLIMLLVMSSIKNFVVFD